MRSDATCRDIAAQLQAHGAASPKSSHFWYLASPRTEIFRHLLHVISLLPLILPLILLLA